MSYVSSPEFLGERMGCKCSLRQVIILLVKLMSHPGCPVCGLDGQGRNRLINKWTINEV